jgi:similar to stage IV sporulation protein
MGKYPESLVNRCAEGGVPLEDVIRDSRGITASIPASELRSLRSLGRGTRCRIHIEKKSGTLSLLAALKENSVFAAALAVFIFAALLFSTRLWFISVDSPVVPEAEIKRMLSEAGVERGVPRRDVKSAETARALLLDPRIVNAKVVLRGVCLNVSVSVISGGGSLESDPEPADVIADRDCVIRYIAVKKGRAEVKAGSAVRAGDVLIRGDLPEVKEGYAVRAEGLVYGEIARVFTATAQRETAALVRSGESVSVCSVLLFGLELFPKLPYPEYELERMGEARLDFSPIPVSIAEYTAYELIESAVPDTLVGTEARARLAAQEKMAGNIPEDAKIIAVNTVLTYSGDGSVIAVLTVTTVEKIGITRSF